MALTSKCHLIVDEQQVSAPCILFFFYVKMSPVHSLELYLHKQRRKCNLYLYSWQIWVKTPEVLARDRLLGSFTVSCSSCLVQLLILLLLLDLLYQSVCVCACENYKRQEGILVTGNLLLVATNPSTQRQFQQKISNKQMKK